MGVQLSEEELQEKRDRVNMQMDNQRSLMNMNRDIEAQLAGNEQADANIAFYLTQGGGGSGVRGRLQAGQILDGSFFAVSMPNFAMKASFEISRRDLRNTDSYKV